MLWKVSWPLHLVPEYCHPHGKIIPRCNELWFLARLSLEKPCDQVPLFDRTHIYRVSVCGRREDGLYWMLFKKVNLKLFHIQLALTFSLPTSHSVIPMYIWEHTHTHTHTHTHSTSLIITALVTITRKSRLFFVSWDDFCPFKVVLTVCVTENSHARWADYFIQYQLLMSCLSLGSL